jgi:hypothetical protein
MSSSGDVREEIAERIAARFELEGWKRATDSIEDWPYGAGTVRAIFTAPWTPVRFVTVQFVATAVIAVADALATDDLEEAAAASARYGRDRPGSYAHAAFPIVIASTMDDDTARRASRNWREASYATYVFPAVVDSRQGRVIYARGLGPGVAQRVAASRLLRRLVGDPTREVVPSTA